VSISVAMCTYNGSAFLRPQLASIADQRLVPDELVVCDDGSTDDTLAVVQEFSTTAPFPVRVQVNECNLGYARNFEQAISLCTSEIVALSDQDDVWLPDKLARSARLLDEHPDVGAVCTDVEIVDRDLNPLGIRMSESLGFGAADQAAVAHSDTLGVLVRTNFVTGATLAFRSFFVPDIVPIPEGWVHDGWIGLVIALRSKVAYINEPLVKYRQHGGNQVGAPRRSRLSDLLFDDLALAAALRQEARKWEAARERAGSLDPDALALLCGKEQHTKTRAGLPDSRLARVPAVLRELVRHGYRRYSAGSVSAIKDLVMRHPASPATT
jgi:glycosyltransferase involved in cell wall biosynthesis